MMSVRYLLILSVASYFLFLFASTTADATLPGLNANDSPSSALREQELDCDSPKEIPSSSDSHTAEPGVKSATPLESCHRSKRLSKEEPDKNVDESEAEKQNELERLEKSFGTLSRRPRQHVSHSDLSGLGSVKFQRRRFSSHLETDDKADTFEASSQTTEEDEQDPLTSPFQRSSLLRRGFKRVSGPKKSNRPQNDKEPSIYPTLGKTIRMTLLDSFRKFAAHVLPNNNQPKPFEAFDSALVSTSDLEIHEGLSSDYDAEPKAVIAAFLSLYLYRGRTLFWLSNTVSNTHSNGPAFVEWIGRLLDLLTSTLGMLNCSIEVQLREIERERCFEYFRKVLINKTKALPNYSVKPAKDTAMDLAVEIKGSMELNLAIPPTLPRLIEIIKPDNSKNRVSMFFQNAIVQRDFLQSSEEMKIAATALPPTLARLTILTQMEAFLQPANDEYFNTAAGSSIVSVSGYKMLMKTFESIVNDPDASYEAWLAAGRTDLQIDKSQYVEYVNMTKEINEMLHRRFMLRQFTTLLYSNDFRKDGNMLAVHMTYTTDVQHGIAISSTNFVWLIMAMRKFFHTDRMYVEPIGNLIREVYDLLEKPSDLADNIYDKIEFLEAQKHWDMDSTPVEYKRKLVVEWFQNFDCITGNIERSNHKSNERFSVDITSIDGGDFTTMIDKLITHFKSQLERTIRKPEKDLETGKFISALPRYNSPDKIRDHLHAEIREKATTLKSRVGNKEAADSRIPRLMAKLDVLMGDFDKEVHRMRRHKGKLEFARMVENIIRGKSGPFITCKCECIETFKAWHVHKNEANMKKLLKMLEGILRNHYHQGDLTSAVNTVLQMEALAKTEYEKSEKTEPPAEQPSPSDAVQNLGQTLRSPVKRAGSCSKTEIQVIRTFCAEAVANLTRKEGNSTKDDQSQSTCQDLKQVMLQSRDKYAVLSIQKFVVHFVDHEYSTKLYHRLYRHFNAGSLYRFVINLVTNTRFLSQHVWNIIKGK